MKNFYAVEFIDGKNTTMGAPNPKTGRLSAAINTAVFYSNADRTNWINRAYKRKAVSVRELRSLKMGLSKSEFDDFLNFNHENMVEYGARS
jgi:hypothetical protein